MLAKPDRMCRPAWPRVSGVLTTRRVSASQTIARWSLLHYVRQFLLNDGCQALAGRANRNGGAEVNREAYLYDITNRPDELNVAPGAFR